MNALQALDALQAAPNHTVKLTVADHDDVKRAYAVLRRRGMATVTAARVRLPGGGTTPVLTYRLSRAGAEFGAVADEADELGAPRVTTAPIVELTYDLGDWTEVEYRNRGRAKGPPLGTAWEIRFSPRAGYSIWHGKEGGYKPFFHRIKPGGAGTLQSVSGGTRFPTKAEALHAVREHHEKWTKKSPAWFGSDRSGLDPGLNPKGRGFAIIPGEDVVELAQYDADGNAYAPTALYAALRDAHAVYRGVRTLPEVVIRGGTSRTMKSPFRVWAVDAESYDGPRAVRQEPNEQGLLYFAQRDPSSPYARPWERESTPALGAASLVSRGWRKVGVRYVQEDAQGRSWRIGRTRARGRMWWLLENPSDPWGTRHETLSEAADLFTNLTGSGRG